MPSVFLSLHNNIIMHHQEHTMLKQRETLKVVSLTVCTIPSGHGRILVTTVYSNYTQTKAVLRLFTCTCSGHMLLCT